MPWIEVFAAGDSLAPIAGGRTGSRGSLALAVLRDYVQDMLPSNEWQRNYNR